MKKRKQSLTYMIAVLLVMAIASGIDYISDGKFNLFSFNDREEVEFVRIVDGDTAHFIYEGEEVTCRFLAIDTPESVKPDTPVEPFGKEASDYTKKVLSEADKIELEFDPKSDKEDDYGRLLAWVWVDDELLEVKLLKEGLAEVKFVYDDYKYLDELYAAQDIAVENDIGIWSLD